MSDSQEAGMSPVPPEDTQPLNPEIARKAAQVFATKAGEISKQAADFGIPWLRANPPAKHADIGKVMFMWYNDEKRIDLLTDKVYGEWEKGRAELLTYTNEADENTEVPGAHGLTLKEIHDKLGVNTRTVLESSPSQESESPRPIRYFFDEEGNFAKLINVSSDSKVEGTVVVEKNGSKMVKVDMNAGDFEEAGGILDLLERRVKEGIERYKGNSNSS